MIALDANGADGGPGLIAEGARRSGVQVMAFGPAAQLAGLAWVVDAPEWIGNHEQPLDALRARPRASIAQAARAVGEGRAGALVSAGSTGATMAASLLHVGSLPGVKRPALAVVLPAVGRRTLLLDAGAGLRADAGRLVEFAHLGAAYMAAVEGIERPAVALLSVGREAAKGTLEVVDAGRALADSELHFAGNVEGADLLAGSVDVVVADGFTGNVALKAMEGAAAMVFDGVREALGSGRRAALGAALARPALRALARRVDPNAHGGAVLLGLRHPVVVAHGASTPEGIAAALRLARRAVNERMVERTVASLEAAAVRSVVAGSFAAGPARGTGT